MLYEELRMVYRCHMYIDDINDLEKIICDRKY